MFKTQYNYDPKVDPGITCTQDERRTKSEFADDCDINKIMGRFLKTGILPEARDASRAIFGDFSKVPTRLELHDLVVAAHEAFDMLPAEVRLEFDNDPARFLAASETLEGTKLLVKHGLGKEPALKPPGEVPAPTPGAGAVAPTGASPAPVATVSPSK